MRTYVRLRRVKPSAENWTLYRAITENVCIGLLYVAYYVWLTTSPLHLAQRPEFGILCFESPLYFTPLESFVATHVFLKPSLQHAKQSRTLRSFEHLFKHITL